MKLNVYAIRDDRTGYLSPITDQNDATAIRNFEHAVMQKDSVYFTHAKDFTLCKIGEYDSDFGLLTSCDPKPICSGNDVKGVI